MICRNCKNRIEDGSLFCRFCGVQLIRTRGRELSVPKPKRLADNSFSGQIMVDGKRMTIHGLTLDEYEQKARAAKNKLYSAEVRQNKVTLGGIMEKYIEDNENVLSPSTIRGYNYILKFRFHRYINEDIHSIDWQRMINEESLLVKPKTLKNSWALVSASLTMQHVSVPNVNLPRIPKDERSWLDYEQINKLLDSVHGKEVEMPVILALHSLRLSELCAVTVDDIYDNEIHVNKSVVRDSYGVLVTKNTNKTQASTRSVPIVINRLMDILPTEGKLVSYSVNAVSRAINTACEAAGLPKVGAHGLRRSFASLCYHLGWSERATMLIGGWSDFNTMHKAYIKLSKSDIEADVNRMKNYYETTSDG